MTQYSLAELDTHCRKATRGAGYSWGLAEEAGRAVRWLESRDLPGASALAGMLTAQEGFSYDDLKPETLTSVWRARSGSLCPLIAGVTLSDHQFEETPTLGVVGYPLLLLPFLANCGLSHPVISYGITAQTDLSDHPLSSSNEGPFSVSPASREIDPQVWAILDRFAYRTYVPSTELSRSGAGAGTTDND